MPSEPMTDERLAEIRKDYEDGLGSNTFWHSDVVAMLREIGRLRAVPGVPDDRQQYETENDRQNELNAAARIAQKYGLSFGSLAGWGGFDFALYEQDSKDVRALVEYKRRHDGPYPDVMEGLDKLVRMREFAKYVSVVYAVEFDDGKIHFVNVRDIPSITPVWGGRTKNTRDEWDVRPVVYIPMDLFTTL